MKFHVFEAAIPGSVLLLVLVLVVTENVFGDYVAGVFDLLTILHKPVLHSFCDCFLREI